MTSSLEDLPRLDLSKAVKHRGSTPHSYTLRNSTHRTAHLDSLTTQYIGCKLLYDRHPYLYHQGGREPRAKCIGPLVLAFERFANWADPKFQIQGNVDFDKIDKANSTMNVAETFILCQQFGIIPAISKPEVMALFAMTVSSPESKYDMDIDWMLDFEKFKGRSGRDLTEQKFPFFLARIAIVMFPNPELSNLQKVHSFIARFKLDDTKYVKRQCLTAKCSKTRRKHDTLYLQKKTGLTGQGAIGYGKITKYLKSILNDVDLCGCIKPLYGLQLRTKKRDWVPFQYCHLNMATIYISNNIAMLSHYRYAIQITNKHRDKSIRFHIDHREIPKYLTLSFKNKVLSPGMCSTVFIKFTNNHKLIRKFNAKKLRSHIPITIMERHHNHHDPKQHILQILSIPITVSFQFIGFEDDKDVFLPSSITTPRDYPIAHHRDHD